MYNVIFYVHFKTVDFLVLSLRLPTNSHSFGLLFSLIIYIHTYIHTKHLRLFAGDKRPPDLAIMWHLADIRPKE